MAFLSRLWRAAGMAWGAASGLTSAATGHVRRRWPKQSGSNIAGGMSFIFYSAYVEDMSVSGRRWQDISAWRIAQKNADFGAGGRYFGETWTDPAAAVW